MMKRVLAVALVLVLGVGLLGVGASAAPTADNPAPYSFFPACRFCGECKDDMEFLTRYYSGAWAFFVFGTLSEEQAFIDGEVPLFLIDFDGFQSLEQIKLFHTLAEQYVLLEAIISAVAWAQVWLISELYNSYFSDFDWPEVDVTETLWPQGYWGEATSEFWALNDMMVEHLTVQGVDVPQWLRRPVEPPPSPACPANPNADVCTCNDTPPTPEVSTIFNTRWKATFVNWLLFFLGFGWIWMWF